MNYELCIMRYEFWAFQANNGSFCGRQPLTSPIEPWMVSVPWTKYKIAQRR